jgi:RNA polymerase sigma-70 factor (ECF subfamily)
MAASTDPGGKETLEQLVERLQPRFQSLLYRYRIPVSEAEDLVQEALLSTVQKWAEIEDSEAWLLTTLRNRCVVYWRRRRKRIHEGVDAALLELLAQPQAAPQTRAELVWDLNQVVSSLPARCRKLLRLRYGLGLDPQEVAVEMGYSPESVRKISARCLSALIARLAELGGPLVEQRRKLI